jgi:thiazole tautomerase (transcriptional regulator TenI)
MLFYDTWVVTSIFCWGGGISIELHIISHEDQGVADLLSCWQSIAPEVDAFHLRYKHRSVTHIAEIVQQLQWSGVVPFSKLIINRYFSLATRFGCAGVHLPEYQTIDADWKQINRKRVRIGRSVHSLAGARQAEAEGVDYIMVGHIFPSFSKLGLAPLGLHPLRQIVKAVQLPVIAVGGITVDQVSEVMSTGCAGIAAISAVSQHHSPLEVVEAFRRRGRDA